MSTAIRVQLLDLLKSCEPQLLKLAAKYILTAPEGIESRRKEYLGARAALALVASPENYDLSWHSEFGYPILKDLTGECLGVSFAHTKGVAVAAVGSFPLGVDIERVDRVVGRALSRITTPEEIGFTHGTSVFDSRKIANGLLFWTAKEAAAKATGLGLRFGLDNFSIDLKPPYRVNVKRQGPIWASGLRVSFRVENDYLLAVAQTSDSPIDLRTYP